MNANELMGMVQTWADALTVAEVVANPFLRVGERWDFHDWESEETIDGIQFRRLDRGRVTATILVRPPDGASNDGPTRIVLCQC
jgi:hypothetical protein